mmetsp:Transcript_142366/g.262311  ORF Transcript_142366/g.262311 Transcript_142366/m.262311 type:complete len:285 (+) Transcript_142366:133-987(+)
MPGTNTRRGSTGLRSPTNLHRKYCSEPLAPVKHREGKASRTRRRDDYHSDSVKQALEPFMSSEDEQSRSGSSQKIPTYMMMQLPPITRSQTTSAYSTARSPTPEEIKVMSMIECANLELMNDCFEAWAKLHKQMKKEEEKQKENAEGTANAVSSKQDSTVDQVQRPIGDHELERSGCLMQLPELDEATLLADSDSEEEAELEKKDDMDEPPVCDVKPKAIADDNPRQLPFAFGFPERSMCMAKLPDLYELFGPEGPPSCTTSPGTSPSASPAVSPRPSPRDCWA